MFVGVVVAIVAVLLSIVLKYLRTFHNVTLSPLTSPAQLWLYLVHSLLLASVQHEDIQVLLFNTVNVDCCTHIVYTPNITFLCIAHSDCTAERVCAAQYMHCTVWLLLLLL